MAAVLAWVRLASPLSVCPALKRLGRFRQGAVFRGTFGYHSAAGRRASDSRAEHGCGELLLSPAALSDEPKTGEELRGRFDAAMRPQAARAEQANGRQQRDKGSVRKISS